MGSSRREPGALSAPLAPRALYVHFPFCVSVCPYCDFVVYAGRAARGPQNRVAALVDALVAEIELRGRAARLNGHVDPLRSVYIGGGTPSLMHAADVARVLATAHETFGIAVDGEITLEVNPGAADRGDLQGFAAAGVNRISIGAQSADATELRRLGRRHSLGDVAVTVAEARSAGVHSVSVDLLYDVPGQTLASWRDTLHDTLGLQPDHVSAYALTLDEHEPSADHLGSSRGARQWRSKAKDEQDEDRAAQMYEVADDLFAAAGLNWYEISNWARAGHASRHNIIYWQDEAWEAVGPGAHAYDGVATRRWNAANLDGYVAALTVGDLPPGGATTSEPSDARAETAILSLRTAAGLPDAVANRPIFQSAFAWGFDNGLLERHDAGVRLTVRGRLLSNELFARLLA